MERKLLDAKRKIAEGDIQSLIIPTLKNEYQKITHKDNCDLMLSAYAKSFLQPLPTVMDLNKNKQKIASLCAIAERHAIQKNYQECIRIYHHCSQRHDSPNLHLIYFNLAYFFLHRDSKQYQKAIYFVQSALKIFPSFGQALAMYANLSIHNLGASEMCKFLQRRLQTTELIQSQEIQNEYLKACLTANIPYSSIAASLHQKKLKITTFYNLAVIFKKYNRFKEAAFMFRRVAQTISAHLYKLSKNELIQQNNKKGIKNTVNCCLFDKKIEQKSWANAAVCYQKVQNSVQAIKCYQKLWNLQLNGYDRQIIGLKIQELLNKKINKQFQSKSCTQNLCAKRLQKNLVHKKQQQISDQKLKFLLLKQKQLNNFFRRLAVTRVQKQQQTTTGNQLILMKNCWAQKQTKIIEQAKKQLLGTQLHRFEQEFKEKTQALNKQLNSKEIDFILKSLAKVKQPTANLITKLLSAAEKISPANSISKSNVFRIKNGSPNNYHNSKIRPTLSQLIPCQNIKMNVNIVSNSKNHADKTFHQRFFVSQPKKNRLPKAKITKQLNLTTAVLKRNSPINSILTQRDQRNHLKSSLTQRQVYFNRENISTNRSKKRNLFENKFSNKNCQEQRIQQCKVNDQVLESGNVDKIYDGPISNHSLTQDIEYLNKEQVLATIKKQQQIYRQVSKTGNQITSINTSKVNSNTKITQNNKQKSCNRLAQNSRENQQKYNQNVKQQWAENTGSSHRNSNKSLQSAMAKMVGMTQTSQFFNSIQQMLKGTVIDNKIKNDDKMIQQQVQTDGNDISFEIYLAAVDLVQSQQKYVDGFTKLSNMYKLFKQSNQKAIILQRIALNFQKQKLYQQAEKTYLKYAAYDKAKALFSIGCLKLKQQDIDKAIQYLQKANCVSKNNNQIEQQLMFAYSLQQATLQKALLLAKDILKRNPQCLKTLMMTAQILQKMGRIKQAIQIMLQTNKHLHTEVAKHYTGLLYLQQGQITTAFNYFTQVLQINPGYLPSIIQIATILSQIKPEESIKLLQQVLQKQPSNKLALTRLGKIYESVNKNYLKAIQYYQRTLLDQQKSYQAFMKIGDCYFQLEDYNNALLNYKQAVTLQPSSDIFLKIGLTFQRKKQLKKAQQSYLQAAQAIQNCPKTKDCAKKKIYFEVIKVSLSLNDYNCAMAFCKNILVTEQSIEAYQYLGQAHFGKGDYNLALDCFEKAHSMCQNDNLVLLQQIAICYDRKEQYRSSKIIYQRIISKDGNNLRCINNLVNILLVMGHTNQAFYWLQMMLQKCPNDLPRRLKVADIYAVFGDWSKVEHHLSCVYKQNQNNLDILQRMLTLYKEKRQLKNVDKIQKKIAYLKKNNKSI